MTRDSQRFRWKGALLGPVPAHWQAAQASDQPGKGNKEPRSEEKSAAGLLVIALEPNGALAKEGIKQGAVITTVAGKPVPDVKTLQQILNDTPSEKWAVGLAEETRAVAAVRDVRE